MTVPTQRGGSVSFDTDPDPEFEKKHYGSGSRPNFDTDPDPVKNATDPALTVYDVNILSRILLRNTQCCSSGSVPIRIIFRHRIFFIWIRPLKTSFAELQTHHYHFIC